MEPDDERPLPTLAQVTALATEVKPQYRTLTRLAAFGGLCRGELRLRVRPSPGWPGLRYQHATAERDEAIANGMDRILETSENKGDQDTNVIRFRRAAE